MISLLPELQRQIIYYLGPDDIAALDGIASEDIIRDAIRVQLEEPFEDYVETVNMPLADFARSTFYADNFYNIDEEDPEWTDALDNAWTYPITLTFPEHAIDFLRKNMFLLPMTATKGHPLRHLGHMVAFDDFISSDEDDIKDLVNVLQEAQYYFPFVFMPDNIAIGMHCHKLRFAIWNYIDDEGNHVYYADSLKELFGGYVENYKMNMYGEEDKQYYQHLSGILSKLVDIFEDTASGVHE